MSEPDALTPRAIATGLAAGALLLLGNLTVGLATGLWDSGQITAALVSFALAAAIPSRARLSPLENDAAQMIACAAAAMPAAMGLLGAVPAMQQLGFELRPHALLLLAFGAAVALLGAGLAFLLAPRLLDEEQLPFPTGAATAELISALHGDGGEARRRTRALLIVFSLTLALIWLRDGRLALIPAALFPPLLLAGASASSLGLGVSVSPLLCGVGVVVGARTGASLALGAIAAWAILGTRLLSRGLVAQPQELGAYLIWPGVSLLVGATVVDLLAQSRALPGSLADLQGVARAALGRFAMPALLLAAVALLAAHRLFGVSYAVGLLALALAAPLSAMVSRAAGQTDVAPVSQAGQLAQAAVGAPSFGAPIADIGAGALVAGCAAESSSLLWSMRVGRVFGARPRTQLRAALLGIAFGALFSLPAYLLLTRVTAGAAPRPSPPGAAQFSAIAQVVTHGASALPAGAGRASLLCLGFGLALALAGRTRLAPLFPSAVALGIGFLIPPAASFTVLIGGLLAALLGRLQRARAAELLPSIAAGLIAGESFLVFVLAALDALGLSRR